MQPREGKPLKMTDEQLAAAAARYVAGMGLEELAPCYGIAPQTLRRYLQGAGVTIRGRGHYATPRPNEYAAAAPETWRCTLCGQGAADGVRYQHQRKSLGPWCNRCCAAQMRAHRAARRAATVR